MLKHIRLAAVIVTLLALTTETAFARGGVAGRTVHVRSYFRQNGTFVQSHDRSAPGNSSGTTRSSSRSTGSTSLNDVQIFPTPAVVTKQVTTTKPSTITATTASKTTTPLSTTASTTSSVNTSTPTQTVVTNPLGITPYVSVPISLNPDASAQRTYGPTLHNARQLIKAGLYSQAADYLRRIINGAPGTRIAAEAQRLLVSLPS